MRDALYNAGFSTSNVIVNQPSRFDWKFEGVALSGDSYAPWEVICAFSGDFDSFVWYYTGSETEIIRLKNESKRQGYTLLDWTGLWNGTTLVAQKEGDIYSSLGLSYVSPEDR